MRPPIEIVSPLHKATLELVCEQAAFRKIVEFVVGQIDDGEEQILPEKVETLLVFVRSEPEVIHPIKERARNIFALWGCGLVSYLLIMFAAGAIGLMGIGAGVVLGWIQGR